MPAMVLASPSALLPGARALLEPFAQVRLLRAAVEHALAPSAAWPWFSTAYRYLAFRICIMSFCSAWGRRTSEHLSRTARRT